MSQFGPYFKKSFVADGALNTTTAQYTCVQMNSEGSVNIVNTTTSDIRFVGILQNQPPSGSAAEVITGGHSKVVINDSLAAGRWFEANSAGQAIPIATQTVTNAPVHIVGKTLEAAAGAGITGTVIECIVMPFVLAGANTEV